MNQNKKRVLTEEQRAKAIARSARWYAKNKELQASRMKESYEKNRNKILERVKKWSSENKDKVNANSRSYRLRNPEKRRQTLCADREKNPNRSKEWRNANLEKCRTLSAAYITKRRKEDPIFRIIGSVRLQTWKALKKKNSPKPCSLSKLVGCSLEFFRKWIESQLPKGMTLENYGKYTWHIDHIIPLSSFDLTDSKQLKIACHYTNLRPMLAKENISKGKKILDPQFSLLLPEC